LVSHQDQILYSIFGETVGKSGAHNFTVRAPVPSIMLAFTEARQNPSTTEKYSFFNTKVY
jgi:hypothetical protein